MPNVASIHIGVKPIYPLDAGYDHGFVNPPDAVTSAKAADIKCLATMIYGEARGEKKVGQVAVAYSAVNRAKGTKSLCDVVLAPKQYSIFNDNPELRAAALSPTLPVAKANKLDKKSWDHAVMVAEEVVQKKVADPTNGATHYVAFKSLNTIPRWVYILEPRGQIGNHTFFKESRGIKIQSGKSSEKTLRLT